MDLRFAIRSLMRQRVFALGAIATLALGIGVNSTIFTFASAALFRPMPGVSDPGRLVWISAVWRERGREVGMSYPEYLDYGAGTDAPFAAMFAFHNTPLSLGSGGEPQRINGQLVSGTYFSGLGALPAAGRLLGPNDDQPGAPLSVVLSHRLWQQRFGGSADAIGSRITINGQQVAVLGVTQPGFHGPSIGEAADLWVPLATLPMIRTSERDLLAERGSSWLHVMGRLRPEASITAAQSVLTSIAARLERTYPDSSANRSVLVSSASSGLAPASRGEFVPLAILLLTVTAIVLLIACANVANLLLARGSGRSMEISIRAAIGASRGRLLRQLLTESLVLAVIGAAAGLLVSVWATDLLQAQLPDAEFGALLVRADARVFLFTGVLALVSVCAFGLLPALTLTRGALLPRLRQTPWSAGGRSRIQGAFVVAQLSLSLVLLLAGGLSLRALQKANSIDLGFDPAGALTASYDLGLQNYTPERRVAFRRELRERIAGLPGIGEVGIANMAPLSGTMVSTVIASQSSTGSHSEARAYLNAAGPGHFAALNMRIVRGRPFGDGDTLGAPRAAIVNERLARDLWGAEDPLGREIVVGKDRVQVVGVAADAKYDEATEDPRPFMYLSLDQAPQLDRETVILRTAAAPAAMIASLRALIQTLDPALPVFDVQPLTTVLRDRADKQRGISALLGAFGAVALLLAALGVYGVMGYAVAQRTREMGIRIALGASAGQLTTLITRDALRLSMFGLAIGGALSMPMAYALGALLFGVQITDIAAFVAICGILVAVAVCASLVPARRAARLDPVVALRAD
ncbi:MAG: ABC transporter permease [Vicinamibacterales bacterium]